MEQPKAKRRPPGNGGEAEEGDQLETTLCTLYICRNPLCRTGGTGLGNGSKISRRCYGDEGWQGYPRGQESGRGLGREEGQPGSFDESYPSDAIKKGKALAGTDRVDVVVHGRDGKIRSKDSYGNESRRRDTEH